MNSRTIAQYGVYTSIFLIMGLVPYLGYIQIGPVRATLMAIPLTIVSLHKKYKGVLYGCFMFAFTSFISSPYNSILFGAIGWSGVFFNLFLTRIMLILPLLIIISIYEHVKIKIYISTFLMGLFITLFNTIFVLTAFTIWGYRNNTIITWFILLAPNIIFEWISIPFVCSFLSKLIAVLVDADKKRLNYKF